MGVEIERKFVLRGRPELLDRCEAQRIEQGYLALDPEAEVRVRRRGGVGLLTVKRGRGLVREEVELPLDDDQFESLWPLTEGRRLTKTRYLNPSPEGVYEIDVYEKPLEGLLVAEIEFESPAASERFEPPDWLGREVTGEAGYENRSLAEHGFPG